MSEDNGGIKGIIVLLVILALVVAFILFMRHQDIKKELQAEKYKMEQDARKLAEKKEREERELREAERKREEEREKQEAERKREEERKREREKQEAERKREEEREKYESIVREKQNRISSLKRQLDEVNNNYVPPESKYISKEIADIDRVLNDNTYKCFDFCINFGNIEFYRVMHHYREEPNSHGYYYTQNPSRYYYTGNRRSKKVWYKVYVSYHCNNHNIDWTRDSVEAYKRNHIPRSQLESKRNRLKSSLDRIIRASKSKGEEEATKIKAAISAAEAELADFEKSHRSSQDK